MGYGLVRLKKPVTPVEPDASRRQFIAGSLLFLAGTSQLVRSTGQNCTCTHKGFYSKGRQTLSCFTSRLYRDLENLQTGVRHAHYASAPAPPVSCSHLSVSMVLQALCSPGWIFTAASATMSALSALISAPQEPSCRLMLEAKKLTQIGKAVFIKDNCIVKTEKTACGACSEHCPTKACSMIPYEGTLVIPEVIDDICIGCGACEHACPTRPYRAIFVDGNPNHEAAKKPEIKELQVYNRRFPLLTSPVRWFCGIFKIMQKHDIYLFKVCETALLCAVIFRIL